MSSVPRVDRALSLPDGPRNKSSLQAGLRTKVSQPQKPVEMTPDQRASVLLDMACIQFGEKNEALGIRIGEAMQLDKPLNASLISRWRSPEHREQPSYAQVIALGSDFNRILRKVESQHFGWAKSALLDLADALGEVAEEMK